MGFLSKLFGRKSASSDEAEGEEIGRVEDYFAKVGVVALRLGRPLAVGDRIRIRGHTTDFSQKVKSMQIEHESVDGARSGTEVGIKVGKRCRTGDRIFKLAT